MSSSDRKQLPHDVVFEIASRTPTLKTLDSCRAISKGWNEVISDPRFMPTFCSRTKNVSGYFLQGPNTTTKEYVNEFVSFNDEGVMTSPSSIARLPRNTMILASCAQGILCCSTREGNFDNYHVRKPVTGQWETLPRPMGGNHVAMDTSMAIMVLSSTAPKLHYKIVRIQHVTGDIGMDNQCCYMCEIFDSKAWRWTDIGTICLAYHEFILTWAPSITASDSIYWMTTKENVVEYCESSESFRKFPLPKLVRENTSSYNKKNLVEYKGQLGFVCLRGDSHFEVWLKEEDDNRKKIIWSRKMEVNVCSTDVAKANLAGFYNSGIAFFHTDWEAMFYRIEDSRLSRVKLDRVRFAREVFPFRSDFELVDLGRPDC